MIQYGTWFPPRSEGWQCKCPITNMEPFANSCMPEKEYCDECKFTRPPQGTAEHLVANRLSDQLAAAHDVLTAVRAWMQGQVRFREDHPQWRGLVENLRVHIARCTEALESTVMKEHPIDPEMKKVQDAFLESMPTFRVGDTIVAADEEAVTSTGMKVHRSVAMKVVAFDANNHVQCSWGSTAGVNSGWFNSSALRLRVDGPDTTRKIASISGVEVDPHTAIAAELIAKAKETKDDGPPRQQAMAENFWGANTKPAIGDIVLVELQLPGLQGQRPLVTMPAIVAALNAEDQTKIGINVFPPIGSGLGAMGQLWASYSEKPTLGCWRWGSVEVRLEMLKEVVLDHERRLAKLETRPAPGPQKPSVGRAVHYYSVAYHHDAPPLHATITAIDPKTGTVKELCIAGQNIEDHDPDKFAIEPSIWFRHNVPFSETPKAGHWSWPVFIK